jgi:adenylate kinase
VKFDSAEARGKRAYRLVLLGAPGVGKGTQAELICERLGTCHLSTGDVFRAAKNLKPAELSPALKAALEYMRRGDLVPDDTVLALVRERARCLHWPTGFLLDGFPRTVPQAEAFDEILKSEKLKLDAVLSYEMPIDQIVARLGGRRTCSKCKAVYHVVNMPPKVEGICDKCGGNLVIREDDRPESIRVRMEAYEKSTSLLVDYYRRKGLLAAIPAQGTPEEVFQRMSAVLKGKA